MGWNSRAPAIDENWEMKLNRECGFELEQIQRVFWPQSLLKDQEIHPDDLEELKFRSVLHKGIWKDYDGITALPSGVIRAREFDRQSISKHNTVESAASGQLREGQAADTFEHLSSRVSLNSEAVESTRKKLKGNPSEESSISFMNFDLPSGSTKKDAKDEEAAPAPGKRRKSGQAAKDKPVGKVKAKAKSKGTSGNGQGNGSKPTKTKGASTTVVPEWRVRAKRARKLQQIDAIELAAKHFVDQFQSEDQVGLLQASAVSSTLDKIKALLDLASDQYMQPFFKDDDGLVSMEGLEKEQMLEAMASKLDLIAEVVEFSKKAVEDQNPDQFCSLLKHRADEVSVKVPLKMKACCILQFGSDMLMTEMSRFGDLLMTQALPTDVMPMRLCLLSEDRVLLETIQGELLYSAVTRIGEEDTEKSRALMKSFLVASLSQMTQF